MVTFFYFSLLVLLLVLLFPLIAYRVGWKLGIRISAIILLSLGGFLVFANYLYLEITEAVDASTMKHVLLAKAEPVDAPNGWWKGYHEPKQPITNIVVGPVVVVPAVPTLPISNTTAIVKIEDCSNNGFKAIGRWFSGKTCKYR